MKAFVGHSFAEIDEDLMNKILNFLFQHGIQYTTGLKPQNQSVSEKVKTRINDNELFIGVFTIGREIAPMSCIKKALSKLSGKSYTPLYTTSNWVIQESGYALGKDKEMILMVEEGVYSFPELQGDKELIYFRRDDMNKSLLRLLTVIQDIKSGVVREEQTASSPAITTEDEKEEDQTEKRDSALFEMLKVYHDGDIPKAEQIYKERAREELENDREKQTWDAVILRWKYCSGSVEAIKELTNLASETNNSKVYKQLAYCYEFAENKEKTIDSYNKSLEKADNVGEKVDCIKNISLCYTRNEEFTTALDLLFATLNDPLYKDNDSQLDIYKALIDVAEKKKDIPLFVMLSEKYLSLNPVDTTVRFNLAYKYNNNKNKDMALYHYKKALTVEKDSSTLNNLGVACSELEMDAKAVEYYKKAVDKDNTLANANLAYKYLNEGFVEEAEDFINRAYKAKERDVDVHSNVGSAKNKLDEMKKKEKEIEENNLKAAEKLHKFMLCHTNAYAISTDIKFEQLSGLWKTKRWGKLNITVDSTKKSFLGKGCVNVEVPQTPMLPGLLSLGLTTSDKKQYKTQLVAIEGKFRNLGGIYSIKVTEEDNHRRTLLTGDEVYSAKGRLIVSKDQMSFTIFEEDSKDKRFYESWSKELSPSESQ